MDRQQERPLNHHPPPPTFPFPFAQPQTAQPPVQIPFSDPFQTSRDPFLPGAHARRDSYGGPGRWPPLQAPGNSNGSSNGHGIPPPHQPSHHASSSSGLPPPPPHAGLGQMFSFDASRRRSLGEAGSPPQYVAGPLEPPAQPPPPFPTRNMPPPSSPQMRPPAASAHLASAPRGPSTASPFAGVRDLPGFAPHRPSNGMAITSILGNGNERGMNSSPRMISSIMGGGPERSINSSPRATAVGPGGVMQAMRPPSPGRVRASSMREGHGRREQSPPRGGFLGEPRAQSAFHERPGPDARREMFASPQLQRESPHSFRAFKPEQQELFRQNANGSAMLGRPSSQPIELAATRSVDDIIARRETPPDGRFGGFRQFVDPIRSERPPRHDAHPFPNGVTSVPREPMERSFFGSPQMDRDRYTPAARSYPLLGTPMREDQAGLFRPVHPQAEAPQESIEAQPLHDHLRREEPRSSPPLSDLPPYLRGRNGYSFDRPMTFEEHQRMEAMQRDEQRKGSDGSAARSMLGISPELNRKGRNSPLPQAVQGAQPRFVGLGGNNPGIKMEFGRMFSGLGSGVGSATPTAGQSMNGTTTPSRLTPSRQLDEEDLVQAVNAGVEEKKIGGRARGGRKNGRRSREEEVVEVEDRMTPDSKRGNKRTKTAHPAHHHHHHLHSHHHHHHHPEAEAQNGSFNLLRFPSNPAAAPAAQSAAHHHHHHHATHGHPTHHHHHHAPTGVPKPRKDTTTVVTNGLLESVASKPRKHLGSQLYTTELSQASNADTPMDSQIKFASKSKPIPLFEGKENCTYTVRVPRFYLASSQQTEKYNQPSALEEVCRRRQVWGAEVYTDDSDVIAAAVHSGWIKGDFGSLSADLRDLCDNASEEEDVQQQQPTDYAVPLTKKPARPVKAPPNHDMHITLLILPPLQFYASTMQHHVRSREWGAPHDGMSFAIHRVDFVDESPATRTIERGAVARKQRMVMEEARRREVAALGLLMIGGGSVNGHAATAAAAAAVSVGA